MMHIKYAIKWHKLDCVSDKKLFWNCKTGNAAHVKSIRAAALGHTKGSFFPVPLSDHGWLGLPLYQSRNMWGIQPCFTHYPLPASSTLEGFPNCAGCIHTFLPKRMLLPWISQINWWMYFHSILWQWVSQFGCTLWGGSILPLKDPYSWVGR